MQVFASNVGYEPAGAKRFVAGAGSGSGPLTFRGYRSDEFVSDWPDDWRRMEQWLPHSTWFLYALAIGNG